MTPPSNNNSGCNVKYHLALEDRNDFLKFHEKLVRLLNKDDSEELAKMIHYPLNHFSKKNLLIKNTKDFVKNYALIFNEKIKNVILNQDRNTFFCQSAGVMYGQGEVWVNNFNSEKKLKIITIHYP